MKKVITKTHYVLDKVAEDREVEFQEALLELRKEFGMRLRYKWDGRVSQPLQELSV